MFDVLLKFKSFVIVCVSCISHDLTYFYYLFACVLFEFNSDS
jgi:hypothetical protein